MNMPLQGPCWVFQSTGAGSQISGGGERFYDLGRTQKVCEIRQVKSNYTPSQEPLSSYFKSFLNY